MPPNLQLSDNLIDLMKDGPRRLDCLAGHAGLELGVRSRSRASVGVVRGFLAVGRAGGRRQGESAGNVERRRASAAPSSAR